MPLFFKIINMSEETKNPEQSRTKIFIDVDSERPNINSIDIEGNLDTLSDVLLQIIEVPGNEGIVDLLDMTINKYYEKYPVKKPQE